MMQMDLQGLEEAEAWLIAICIAKIGVKTNARR